MQDFVIYSLKKIGTKRNPFRSHLLVLNSRNDIFVKDARLVLVSCGFCISHKVRGPKLVKKSLVNSMLFFLRFEGTLILSERTEIGYISPKLSIQNCTSLQTAMEENIRIIKKNLIISCVGCHSVVEHLKSLHKVPVGPHMGGRALALQALDSAVADGPAIL